MLLLPNVLVDTSRSALNAQQGTMPPQPWLDGVAAHARPTTTGDYHALPAGALESDYIFGFDQGTDVDTGDIFTSVVLRSDGATPWASSTRNTNETLRVVLADDATAGFLTYRRAFVKRFTGGGPSY